MKKVLVLSAVMLVALSAFAAKPKGKLQLTLDFSQAGALTPVAAAADQPAKPSFKTPRSGVAIPTKRVKEAQDAVSMGYIEANKDDKPGFWFPWSAYTFESDGQQYPIIFGTVKADGRSNNIYYSKKMQAYSISRPTFSIPQIEGMVLKSVKAYVLASKYSNERFVLQFFKNYNKKEIITKSTAPVVNEDSVLEANFADLTSADQICAFSNASFVIKKIEFNYQKEKKAKK